MAHTLHTKISAICQNNIIWTILNFQKHDYDPAPPSRNQHKNMFIRVGNSVIYTAVYDSHASEDKTVNNSVYNDRRQFQRDDVTNSSAPREYTPAWRFSGLKSNEMAS